MRFAVLILAALCTLCSARAQDTLVYDSSTPSFFYNDAISKALDDGVFPADYGTPTTFDALDFAFSVTSPDSTGSVVSFDAVFTFYGALNPAAPAGEPVNTGPVGTFTVPIRDFATFPGSYYTAIDTVGTESYPMPAPISLPASKWAVELKLLDPATKEPFTPAKIVFAGGRVSIGSNDPGFHFDTNGNGIYEANERYVFSIYQLAHFYLKLYRTKGSTNPPQSLVALRVAAGISPCDATGPYSFASLNVDASGASANAVDMQDAIALLTAGL